jgi:glycosyltransferase involved in cell wall biosynthesis
MMANRILYVDNRVKYVLSHRIPWLEEARAAGFNVHVTTLTAGEGSRVEEVGFPYHSISKQRRSNNPLHELQLVACLYKLYRRLQPDIIHQITLRSILYGGMASLFVREPAIVNGVTGLGYLFTDCDPKIRALRKSVLWALWALRQGRCQTYLFQNPDDKRLFRQNGVADSSNGVLIKGSGVETEKFRQRPEPSGTPIVLFPARMLWHKGVQEFVDAARIVNRNGQDVRFVMVGDTDADNPAGVSAEQLKQWEYEGVIEWWGYQESMPDVFAQSHIVCLPSKYREGVPKVLIEAASCGRPIVTTDMPGCREIVQDGENGILVPAGDSGAVADAIIQLLEEAELRAKMGDRGRALVQKEFSVERVVEKTVEVYRDVLQKKQGRLAGIVANPTA